MTFQVNHSNNKVDEDKGMEVNKKKNSSWQCMAKINNRRFHFMLIIRTLYS